MEKTFLKILFYGSLSGFIGSLLAFIFYWLKIINFDDAIYIWLGLISIGSIFGGIGGTNLFQYLIKTKQPKQPKQPEQVAFLHKKYK